MNIVASYDSSADSAPSWFKAAVDAAIGQMDLLIANPITVNITFSWGEENNSAIRPGCAGQNQFCGSNLDYAQFYGALKSHATTADDETALAALTATNPLGSALLLVPTALQKALGLDSPAATATDGYIGLASSLDWAFNPDGAVTNGAYNPVECLEHEISEVLGRVAFTAGQSANTFTPLDLFRYTGPGQHDFIQGSGYFSVDGHTMEQAFNNPGDAADWSPAVVGDAFGNIAAGTGSSMSATDLQVMDVLGYTLGTPPAPLTSASAEPGKTVQAAFNATLTSSGGGNTFVFRPHPGHVKIAGFAEATSLHDVLSFANTSFSSIADLLHHARQVGHAAVITIDARDTITLQGTSAATLKHHPADFAFQA